jgi:diguanylate cyclase (GGDEF)-like protein
MSELIHADPISTPPVILVPDEHKKVAAPPVILVADDDKVMRICLRQVMEQEGYTVVEAFDGESCLATFSQLQPAVVLLDAVMPVMDGFTCCERIKRIDSQDGTPVLMITGLEDDASVDQAFLAGAADFVTKPIHWQVLRQRVKRLLKQVELYAELKQANLELKRLATSDGLTQVANRRHFDEYLQQEWLRMQREQMPMSLILCDIDFFKAFNDTYGHQAGDECLQKVAQVIQKAAKRSIDLAARYGGEEFAVILPNTDLEGAERVALDIQAHIAGLQIFHRNSKVSQHVTVSMGISSTIPNQIIPPEMLITAADRALYQSKDSGRNQFRTFSIP